MQRILFVDDDTALLDGLRGRLRPLRSKYEMVFVESGTRAIAEIEQRSFDVVVSDMRMPRMDGADLLAIVKTRWPQTIRIVLSGYAEEEQAARVVSIAHQYLSKPCDAQELENVLARCSSLDQVLSEPKLRALVGRIQQMPAVPKTYAKLRSAMEQSDVSIKDVADIIAEDPAVAARVLQVVNSAFFRLAKRINRLDQAVNYLGFNAVRNIVMSVEVFSLWPTTAAFPELDPERLQIRAHKVAAIARSLCHSLPFADDALLAGLFHNLGYWILLQECPKEMEQVVRCANANNMPMFRAEKELLGASHAEIGAYLLGLWGLPYSVIEAVAFQHNRQGVHQRSYDTLAALVVALATLDSVPAAQEPCVGDPAVTDEYLLSIKAPFDWAEARARAESVLGEADHV
jgi:HD-like signal output (HDOD) protein